MDIRVGGYAPSGRLPGITVVVIEFGADESNGADAAEPQATAASKVVAVGSFALVFLVSSNMAIAFDFGIGNPVYKLSALLVLMVIYQQVRELGWASFAHSFSTRVLIAVALFAAFGVVRTASRLWGGAFTISWLKDILVVVAVVVSARSLREVGRLSWAVVLAIAVLGGPALIQHLTGTYGSDWLGLAQTDVGFIDGERRFQIGGTLGGPNPLVQWLVTAIPLAAYHARWSKSGRYRALAATLLAVAIAATVASQSRQGLLLLVVVGVVLLVDRRPSRSMVIKAVALVGVLAAIVFVSNPTRWTRQGERIGEVSVLFGGDVGSDSSAAGYAGTFRAGLDMFVDNPLLGIGHKQFVEEYLSYAETRGIDTSGRARSAHNTGVHVLAETGLVGALAFLAMVAALFSVNRRSVGYLRSRDCEEYAQLGTALRSALFIWLVSSLFQGLFHPEQVMVVAALVIALGVATDNVGLK
ncbi:MAG: O-antigen ligase family protein, partial [Acidimicrobiales bacterium]